MDSSERIVVTEEIEKLLEDTDIVDGPEDLIEDINSYIEITRHLKELYQWYNIFNYNYDMIKRLYPKGNIDVINSHTITLISAGKNLVESCELCIKKSFCDGEKKKQDFRTKYSSKEYDENFNYRFLIKMRNFTQHGHIPVSNLHDRLGFDVTQIYDSPHYKFDKTLKKRAEQLIEEVRVEHKNNLVLSYSGTIGAYSCSVYKIYLGFLQWIQVPLFENLEKIKKIIEDNPEIISHPKHPKIDGLIFWKEANTPDCIHVFNSADNPTVKHRQVLNDTIDRFKKEKECMKKFKKKIREINN